MYRLSDSASISIVAALTIRLCRLESSAYPRLFRLGSMARGTSSFVFFAVTSFGDRRRLIWRVASILNFCGETGSWSRRETRRPVAPPPIFVCVFEGSGTDAAIGEAVVVGLYNLLPDYKTLFDGDDPGLVSVWVN